MPSGPLIVGFLPPLICESLHFRAVESTEKKTHQSQASKTVTIRPAKLPLGPHATKPLWGAHEKLQQMTEGFCGMFSGKHYSDYSNRNWCELQGAA